MRLHHSPSLSSCLARGGARQTHPRPLPQLHARRRPRTSSSTAHVMRAAARIPDLPQGAARRVHVSAPYETRPGQDLLLAGSSPELGSWDASHGLRLEWGEGHVWHTPQPLSLQQGTRFKLVVQQGGSIMWEPGPDRGFEPPDYASTAESTPLDITLTCKWGHPTEVTSAAPAPPAAAPAVPSNGHGAVAADLLPIHPRVAAATPAVPGNGRGAVADDAAVWSILNGHGSSGDGVQRSGATPLRQEVLEMQAQLSEAVAARDSALAKAAERIQITEDALEAQRCEAAAAANGHQEAACLASRSSKEAQEHTDLLRAELKEARSNAESQARQSGHEIAELQRELIDTQRRAEKAVAESAIEADEALKRLTGQEDVQRARVMEAEAAQASQAGQLQELRVQLTAYQADRQKIRDAEEAAQKARQELEEAQKCMQKKDEQLEELLAEQRKMAGDLQYASSRARELQSLSDEHAAQRDGLYDQINELQESLVTEKAAKEHELAQAAEIVRKRLADQEATIHFLQEKIVAQEDALDEFKQALSRGLGFAVGPHDGLGLMNPSTHAQQPPHAHSQHEQSRKWGLPRFFSTLFGGNDNGATPSSASEEERTRVTANNAVPADGLRASTSKSKLQDQRQRAAAHSER